MKLHIAMTDEGEAIVVDMNVARDAVFVELSGAPEEAVPAVLDAVVSICSGISTRLKAEGAKRAN